MHVDLASDNGSNKVIGNSKTKKQKKIKMEFLDYGKLHDTYCFTSVRFMTCNEYS
jgi:hypothetical protein